jgi:hypothetical protein
MLRGSECFDSSIYSGNVFGKGENEMTSHSEAYLCRWRDVICRQKRLRISAKHRGEKCSLMYKRKAAKKNRKQVKSVSRFSSTWNTTVWRTTREAKKLGAEKCSNHFGWRMAVEGEAIFLAIRNFNEHYAACHVRALHILYIYITYSMSIM